MVTKVVMGEVVDTTQQVNSIAIAMKTNVMEVVEVVGAAEESVELRTWVKWRS
jgi:hypothetical protein